MLASTGLIVLVTVLGTGRTSCGASRHSRDEGDR
jgi:hypothetical protein